jgi:hypothetical protein
MKDPTRFIPPDFTAASAAFDAAVDTVNEANSVLSFRLGPDISEHAAWARQQVARMTYKPGWKLLIEELPLRSFMVPFYLIVTASVENTYRRGETIQIGGYYSVPWHFIENPSPDRDTQFARWVADQIKDAEIHESREWFKVDGGIFDNPHKE